MKEKAVLVVSFGTGYLDAYRKATGKLEQEIQQKYPEYEVVRAWTSEMIRKKVEMRDGVHIFNVKEALERLRKGGVKEVVVQPAYVLNGSEHITMIRATEEFRTCFQRLVISTPLLTTSEDMERVADILIDGWKLKKDEMLLFMGHGTGHQSHSVYSELNVLFKAKGCANMIIGTVKGSPTVEELIDTVKQYHPRHLILAPFLLVSGAHANQDLAGEKSSSWKSMFAREGFDADYAGKGLGEYPEFRQLIMEHLEAVMNQT